MGDCQKLRQSRGFKRDKKRSDKFQGDLSIYLSGYINSLTQSRTSQLKGSMSI